MRHIYLKGGHTISKIRKGNTKIEIKTRDKTPKGRKNGQTVQRVKQQFTAKYRKELAQQPKEEERPDEQAMDHIECTAEESVHEISKITREGVQYARSTAQKRRKDKLRSRADDTAVIQSPTAEPPAPQEQIRQVFIKGRQKQTKPQQSVPPPQKPTAPPTLPAATTSMRTSVYSKQTVHSANPSIHPSSQALPAHQGWERPAIRERMKSTPTIKQKPQVSTAAIKTRQNTEQLAPKIPQTPIKTAASGKAQNTVRTVASTRAKKHAQRQMQRSMVQRTQQTAKAAAELSKKIGVAIAKAVAAMVSAVAGLVGGATLLVALCIVMLVAAVVASPFGIFFSDEQKAPDAVSPNAAVAQINAEYAAKLEELQEGDYDNIVIHGAPPDWREVIAVFACKTAGADDGVDVTTFDADRVERLRAVFWDMTEITTEAETIAREGSTETILHVTVTANTTDEMRTAYHFTNYQNEALDSLLQEMELLGGLLGDLSINQADAIALLENLPKNLSPERKAVIQHALTLVGKVNYFWGGKSLTLGWDSRWGTTMKVTAEGSSSTGTYRPYGLDCSGFVDWVFYNASGGSYVIGHGGGAASQHTYCTVISWSEAIPGDLVFYPEDSHVGIVGGRDESGNLLIIHCTSGYNNVVITGLEGFTSIGRPTYYTD